MTYAYDDYVQMPTKDLYDTAVMKMAIEAAKDMYDKGQTQMENFYKTYGDFMSPIAKDMQWYGQRMNNVRQTVNDAYARGIDLFKSPEGRAIVAQLSHSIDPMQFNMMRQSAENAKTFLKAKAELQAQGLYNPLLAPYDEPSLSDYSTIESGVWGKMSPTPYQNIATFGNPYFEGMKPNVRKESKNGIDYTVESITEEDLRNIADSHFNDLVNTPQGQLMYKYYQDLAKQTGVQDVNAAAREMFNSTIVDGQRRRIYTKDDYDDNWLNRKKYELDEAQLNWQMFTDSVQLGLDPNNPTESVGNASAATTGTDMSYTTQMETNSIAKYNKEAGIDSPADYAQTTYDIAKYWEDKAAKETNSSKKEYAEKISKYWTRISKDGLQNAEKNGILVRDKRTGELIPSKTYAKEIGLAYGAPSTGKTSLTKAREQADVYYNKFLMGSGGTEYNSTSADLLAGGTGEKYSFPGGAATNKYRVVQLDDKDIYYTPLRRLRVAGYNVNDLSKAPSISEFNNWLKSSSRIGYMVNSNTSTASLPTVNGGRTREISGYVRIPWKDFESGFLMKYIPKYKETHKNAEDPVSDLLTELGLSIFKMHSREPLKGKYTWEEADVIEIPITRVAINMKSAVDSSWNTHHDENTSGKQAASKKTTARQIESLNKK